MRLERLPATRRSLQSPGITSLFVAHCGPVWLRKQPYRGKLRNLKSVSCIACRSLAAALEKFLRSRPAVGEETFPFLTKLLGTTSDAEQMVPRRAPQFHEPLKESATVLVAPLGHRGLGEKLSAADAWYSLTMRAALELPDVPFRVLLSICAMTGLRDVISQGRARFAQAAAVQRVPTPTVSEVCEVLQSF